MREILFKAKRISDGKWVEGSLVMVGADKYVVNDSYFRLDGHHIACDSDTPVFIDETTICQYTGLTDKNGNKIWENDVVNIHIFHEVAEGYGEHIREKGVICYDKIGMLSIAVDITDGVPCYSDILFQAEIAGINFDIEAMGNIFDNPELLGG